MEQRVAIVDWDVHHGNGTQHTFYEDADVLYMSLHEFPFYPGTGWVDEMGDREGRGMTVNIPLPNGTDAMSYLAAFDQIATPILHEFKPDWILVSSGYDAHRLDPLGGLLLESEHYGWMACRLASVVPSNRIISFLEGGYDLSALATGSVATIEGATGAFKDIVWPTSIAGSAARTVAMASEALGPYWDIA
jgi:acetoin utilization deacetylase AcuC-like enzyme